MVIHKNKTQSIIFIFQIQRMCRLCCAPLKDKHDHKKGLFLRFDAHFLQTAMHLRAKYEIVQARNLF